MYLKKSTKFKKTTLDPPTLAQTKTLVTACAGRLHPFGYKLSTAGMMSLTARVSVDDEEARLPQNIKKEPKKREASLVVVGKMEQLFGTRRINRRMVINFQ